MFFCINCTIPEENSFLEKNNENRATHWKSCLSKYPQGVEIVMKTAMTCYKLITCVWWESEAVVCVYHLVVCVCQLKWLGTDPQST